MRHDAGVRLGALTAIDLFSGPGGLTQGLKQAGFHVVAAVEVDALAAKTLQYNHPEVLVERGDIREVDPAALLERLGLDRIDLIAGCPPCQGFSTVRTRNAKHAAADPRNDLIDEYVRFVRILKPRAIILENVPGLGRDQRWERAAKQLEELGYPAGEGMSILDAADYGVPQRRRRLVMVAMQDGAAPEARKAKERRTVRQAITGLPVPGDSGDPLHDLPEKRSDKVMEIIRAVPHDGGGRLDLPDDQRLDCHKDFDGFKDVYGRMHWDKPSPTITGGCHNPSKGRFLHPDQDRTITLREAAMLQGFPRGYYFALDRGKLAAATMIGNALPPAFIEAQATPVFEILTKDGA